MHQFVKKKLLSTSIYHVKQFQYVPGSILSLRVYKVIVCQLQEKSLLKFFQDFKRIFSISTSQQQLNRISIFKFSWTEKSQKMHFVKFKLTSALKLLFVPWGYFVSTNGGDLQLINASFNWTLWRLILLFTLPLSLPIYSLSLFVSFISITDPIIFISYIGMGICPCVSSSLGVSSFSLFYIYVASLCLIPPAKYLSLTVILQKETQPTFCLQFVMKAWMQFWQICCFARMYINQQIDECGGGSTTVLDRGAVVCLTCTYLLCSWSYQNTL